MGSVEGHFRAGGVSTFFGATKEVGGFRKRSSVLGGQNLTERGGGALKMPLILCIEVCKVVIEGGRICQIDAFFGNDWA